MAAAGVQQPQLVHGELIDAACSICGAIDRLIVDHGKFAVSGQIDVELDRVASRFPRALETRERVLRCYPGGAAAPP